MFAVVDHDAVDESLVGCFPGMDLVEKQIPSPSEAEIVEAVAAALGEASVASAKRQSASVRVVLLIGVIL